VRTKVDKLTAKEWTAERENVVIGVSAETGEGLTELLGAITDILDVRQRIVDLDAPLLTHARHRYTIQHARDELVAFQRAWLDAQLPAPVAAVHLRAAVHALEELIGAVDVEDILGRVFASFCVGK
jgi:tRNA modification GTPase